MSVVKEDVRSLTPFNFNLIDPLIRSNRTNMCRKRISFLNYSKLPLLMKNSITIIRGKFGKTYGRIGARI